MGGGHWLRAVAIVTSESCRPCAVAEGWEVAGLPHLDGKRESEKTEKGEGMEYGKIEGGGTACAPRRCLHIVFDGTASGRTVPWTAEVPRPLAFSPAQFRNEHATTRLGWTAKFTARG